jgi:hypothetical protein
LQQAAAASGVPLELLAAAVGADLQEREAVEAAASRDDAAWHLLHDASVVAANEEAVLLPAVLEVGGVAKNDSIVKGICNPECGDVLSSCHGNWQNNCTTMF